MTPGPEARRRTIATAIAAVFLAAAVFTRAQYWEFFLRAPGLVAIASLIALVMYLPSIWFVRRRDRQPLPWTAYAFAAVAVVSVTPLTSEVTWALINRGFRYWQVVGLTEETTKMLPALLCLALAPRWLRTTSDGFVIGAMAGLGFAVIEFATSFALDNFPQNGWLDLATSVPSRWNLGTQHHILWAAVTGGAIGRWRESPRSAGAIVFAVTAIAVVIGTHSLQDLYGKYLGPLSIGLIGAPLVQLGLTEDMMALGHPVSILLMFTGAMINFLLINLPVFGFLLAHLRRMRRSGSFA